jgi:hypothetical protein
MSSFKKVPGVLKEAAQRSFDNHFRFERELLMGELCQYFRVIDVNAILLEPENPEAFRYPPYILGHVKIEGRNVDAILVQFSSSGDDTSFAWYRYFYVVRANLDGLESKLKADFKSNWHDRCCQKRNFKRIDGTLIDREVSDCRWEGGELAQLLNADSDLTQTLYNEGLDRLEIRSDRGHRCVRIEHWHWKVYSSSDIDGRASDGTYAIGRKQFPNREAFEAYEGIAYAIRRVILTSPPNSTLGM